MLLQLKGKINWKYFPLLLQILSPKSKAASQYVGSNEQEKLTVKEGCKQYKGLTTLSGIIK